MKLGPILSVGIALAAAGGLTAVFMRNASPYAKISEVRQHLGSDDLHVVGQLVPKSLNQDPLAGKLDFRIKDETGELAVSYTGSPISNLEQATQVVVIGSYRDGSFHARDMLVKCPSKYESETVVTAMR